MTPLVELNGLELHYPVATLADRVRFARPVFKALDGVSLQVARGETLGIVGESGSGKSTLARVMLGFTAPTAGDVIFDGANIAALDRAGRRAFHRRAQMIFQDPSGSLNPRLTVRQCLDEVLRVTHAGDRLARQARMHALLDMVGLPRTLMDRHPAGLSGGQCQRVGIARALAVGPDLLVPDEATAALDVSIQAQILNLLADLKRELGLTMVFISHNLGVVRHICDRVAVMQRGRIVEIGPTQDVLGRPRHSYTQALIAAIPAIVAESFPEPHRGAYRAPGVID
jgi:peptide/nickel transport system ATP-binding protein